MNISPNSTPPQPAGQRGPVEHERREQIIAAADEHFRQYGYGKTTVADLAKAIGVSSAYVYRFFDSKQSIGEAVCALTLERMLVALDAIVSSNHGAAERLRRIYKELVVQGVALYFNERRLHDIVVAAVGERWRSVENYKIAIHEVVRRIVLAGRESGEFERKTPLDETCRAIVETLTPFCHPILLEQTSRESLDENAVAVSNLVLRSLAP